MVMSQPDGTTRTVLVADDHVRVHDVMRRILEPEYEIIQTVVNGRELVDAARELKPAVIVADVSMPEMNGIEAVRLLKQSAEGGPPTVFVSAHSEPSVIADAMSTGAEGYVLKGRAPFDLKPAVKAAVEGKRFFSSGLADPSEPKH